jgi:very-short-patch-repair endonuclease
MSWPTGDGGECHTPLANSAGMTSNEMDAAIDELARRQYGVFSRSQAVASGATARMIDRRLGSGGWIELAPAVYALRSHPGTWERTLMAAVLGEPRAAVWGRSAAALHELEGFRPGRTEIVVPRGSNHRSALAVVRERRQYETTTVRRLPVLTIADTLFALAALSPPGRVAVALDHAMAAKQVTIGALLHRYLDLAAGRPRGIGVMRGLLEVRCEDGFVPPQSVLEHLLYDGVLDRPGMPRYQRQFALPWSPDERADAALLDFPVIIEADGRRWHTRVADFEHDRRRDRMAALHGYHTLRYTFEDMQDDADRVASEICAITRTAA